MKLRLPPRLVAPSLVLLRWFVFNPRIPFSRQRTLSADLVVIGKRQRGLLGDFFLGRLTREVLVHCTADVLVLPQTQVARQGSA